MIKFTDLLPWLQSLLQDMYSVSSYLHVLVCVRAVSPVTLEVAIVVPCCAQCCAINYHKVV